MRCSVAALTFLHFFPLILSVVVVLVLLHFHFSENAQNNKRIYATPLVANLLASFSVFVSRFYFWWWLLQPKGVFVPQHFKCTQTYKFETKN